MLPPVRVRNAGGDHAPVSGSRAEMNPRPRWPPKMNPARIVDGNTAMAVARSRIASGMDASGASMISWRTTYPSASRSVSPSAAAVAGVSSRVRPATVAAFASRPIATVNVA